MTFPESAWVKYINMLSAINNTAAKKFTAYLNTHDVSTALGRKSAIDYAYALATQYGETAAAAACEMYDAVAEASGIALAAAEPAATAAYGEVAKAVNGLIKQNMANEVIGESIGRLVKRSGADTTLQNAKRDGAEFAWVPHGDTCSFCLMLASNGWQKASKKTIKGDHAEHIHANCDCTFAIRFDGKSSVGGYDPDKFREMYDNAEGNTWKEKLNSMRRDNYAKNADEIRAQKREAYAIKHGKGIKPKGFEFVPAETIKEAEDYLRQFVDTGIFGAIGVSYEGVSVDVANQVNETLGRLLNRYDVGKIGGIKAPAGNTKEGKALQGAIAAYSPIRKSFYLSRNGLKTSKKALDSIQENNKIIARFINNPDSFDLSKVSKRTADIMRASLKSGRATVPESIEDALTHEFGHFLEPHLKNISGYQSVKGRMLEFAENISGYATSDFSEYVAESFCAYTRGETVVDPELIKLFKQLERR